MNVSLPLPVEDYIQTQLQEGKYLSADQALGAILNAGIQALQQAANSAITTKNMQSREIGYHLHLIEGNPLTDNEKALFARFDEQGLTVEERIEYLTRKLRDKSLFAELA